MNNFLNLIEILNCIKNNTKTHVDFCKYVDFSNVCKINFDDLEEIEYQNWFDQSNQNINLLIENDLLIENITIKNNIFAQDTQFYWYKDMFVRDILQGIHNNTKLEYNKNLLFIFCKKTDKALTLLDYINKLASYIINQNKDIQTGLIREYLCFNPAVMKFDIFHPEIFNFCVKQLIENKLILIDANRGGEAMDSYKLTDEGKITLKKIDDGNNIFNIGESTVSKTNTFHIGSVGNLANADTINNQTTTATTTNFNTNFQQVINESNLTKDEKECLNLLYKKDVTFSDRIWELFNSAIHGAASGIASKVL